MADPISVISLLEGSIGLVVQCGSVAKTLSDMIAQFKHAEVALMSLIQEVETIQFAWSRIKEWSEEHAEAATDSQFVQRLKKSLQCGTLVLSALEQDLADYKHTADTASFKLRSKMVWNERAFLDHRNRVRGQVQAMTLMLQVSQLSTSTAQSKLLKKNEKTFRASDESAYSIVPSRMSSRMSASTRSRDSVLTIESRELVYYPLSFEDDLFTARVYKRNYRTPWIDSLVKLRWGKKKEERKVPTANPEASEDGQSLLSSSTRPTTPKALSVDLLRPWPSNQDIPLQDLRPVSPSPAVIAEKKVDPTNFERSMMIPGSIPSTFEESPSIGSSLQNGAMDPSIKPMYTAERQPDISGANSPAPGHNPQIYSVSNVAVGRPSLVSVARYDINRSLLLAVKEGNFDAVETLIHQGAQINPHEVLDRPPLYLAVQEQNVSMTRFLLQKGANYAQGWRGTLPIHQACKYVDLPTTRLLLDAGASASSLDALQEQPLHKVLSSQFSNPDAHPLRDLLISRGADVNAPTRAGATPLHLACENVDVVHFRVLLGCGADPNSTDRCGRTAFHVLAENVACSLSPAILRLSHTRQSSVRPYTQWAAHAAFFKLLLVYGANMNTQDKFGDTPFHLLVTSWDVMSDPAHLEAVIQLSLQHGVNVDAQNKVGDTPLHLLVTRGLKHKVVIELLLKHGANVNVQNKVGDTPLHILVTAGLAGLDGDRYRTVDKAGFQSLIKHGAQVNTQNVAGDTPLHLVARRGHSREENAEWKNQLISCLFDAGADLSVKNLSEETPRQLLGQFKDRSVLRKAALVKAPQASMSEGDEDESVVKF